MEGGFVSMVRPRPAPLAALLKTPTEFHQPECRGRLTSTSSGGTQPYPPPDEGKEAGRSLSCYFATAFTTIISTTPPPPTNIITAMPPSSVAPNFHSAALQKLSPPGFNPEAPAASRRRNFTAASLDPDQEIQMEMCRRACHRSALQRGLHKTATHHETSTSPSPPRKPACFLSSKAFPKQWANYQGNVSGGLEKKGASLPNASRPGARRRGEDAHQDPA